MELFYLEGANYSLCACSSCSAIYQQEIPNKAFMERIYEIWINPQTAFNLNQKPKGLGYFSYCAQEIMQVIAFLGKKPSELQVLDFGMGWGRWILMAKAFGCSAYGSELSSERIEYAKANGIEVLAWNEIPKYQFDFINTEQVFEHLSHPLETLQYLKTALKPGGMLKISVPVAIDIDRRLKIMDWKAPKGSRNSLNPVAPLEHINYYRRSSLLKMAAEAGMMEVMIPIKTQYQYLTDWSSLRTSIKNLLRPLYRNLLKKQNYIFLQNMN